MLAKVGFVHGLVPSANNTVVPGDGSIGTEMLFCLILPVRFPWLAQTQHRRDPGHRRGQARVPVGMLGHRTGHGKRLIARWSAQARPVTG